MPRNWRTYSRKRSSLFRPSKPTYYDLVQTEHSSKQPSCSQLSESKHSHVLSSHTVHSNSVDSDSVHTNSATSSQSKPESVSVRDEIEMRTVKIIDIGYITIVYFILAVLVSIGYDKAFGIYDPQDDDKKSIYRVALELIGIMWLFGVTIYIARNVVELIPSPLSYVPLSNPNRKFDHTKLKELTSASVFIFIFIGTNRFFKDKFFYFYNRFFKELDATR